MGEKWYEAEVMKHHEQSQVILRLGCNSVCKAVVVQSRMSGLIMAYSGPPESEEFIS